MKQRRDPECYNTQMVLLALTQLQPLLLSVHGRRVIVWSLDSNASMVLPHPDQVAGACFSPAYEFLCTTCMHGAVSVFDLPHGGQMLWQVDTNATIEASPAYHEGRFLVPANRRPTTAYDTATGVVACLMTEHACPAAVFVASARRIGAFVYPSVAVRDH